MKTQVLALALATFAASANANTITVEEARAICAGSSKKAFSEKTIELAHVMTGEATGAATLYVFNRGEGMVVVSANDEAGAIMGYTDNGNFDFATAPDALKEWLRGTSAGIEALSMRAGESAKAMRVAPRERVAPLMTTTWGQGEPYNAMCPQVDGGNALAGCVPLAMAQIMRYHGFAKYVEQTTAFGRSFDGYANYTVAGSDGRQDCNMSISASDVDYDFGAMPNSLNANTPEAGSAAVAKMIQHLGALANAEYSATGTGANNLFITYALRTLGYDKGMRMLPRTNYTINEWDDIIYNEVAANRPVLYLGAVNNYDAHAFVCDGYEDGFYHINWGWNGKCNGFFSLDYLCALSGRNQEGNYSIQGVWALVGIQPALEGSAQGTSIQGLGVLTASTVDNGLQLLSKSYNSNGGYIAATSAQYMEDITLYAKFTNNSTGETEYRKVRDLSLCGNSVATDNYYGDTTQGPGGETISGKGTILNSRYYKPEVSTEGLDGTYTLSLAYTAEGLDGYQNINFSKNGTAASSSLKVVAEDGVVTKTTNLMPAAALEVTDVKFEQPKRNARSSVTLTVTNTSAKNDYYGYFSVKAAHKQTVCYCSGSTLLALAPNESKAVTVALGAMTIEDSYIANGYTYSLWSYAGVVGTSGGTLLASDMPLPTETANDPINPDELASYISIVVDMTGDDDTGEVNVDLTIKNKNTDDRPFYGNIYTFLATTSEAPAQDEKSAETDGEEQVSIVQQLSADYVQLQASETTTLSHHNYVSEGNPSDYDIVVYANNGILDLDIHKSSFAFGKFNSGGDDDVNGQNLAEEPQKSESVVSSAEFIAQDSETQEIYHDINGKTLRGNIAPGVYVRTVIHADGSRDSKVVRIAK